MPYTRKRIVVVEDEKLAAALLCETMRKVFDIEGVHTMADGMARCGSLPPIDGLILDLHLPDADNCEDVIKKFHDTHPDVPIVVLTGCDIDPEVARAVGASVFLSKPQDSAAVIDAMHWAINARQNARDYAPLKSTLAAARACLDESVNRIDKALQRNCP